MRDIIIPVRCFTCGRLIADKFEEFARRVKAGERPSQVMDEMGMKRYCCRRMLASHVEVIDEFLKYSEIAASKRAEME